MGRKFGFSWSWKRASGLSALKGRISRKIGVPLTKSGRQKKVGRLFGGWLGLWFLLGGRRSNQSKARSNTARSGGATPSRRLEESPRSNETIWGDPPPTAKQVRYARHLGVRMVDGMTKETISEAIDEAIEKSRAHEPATREQLREIAAMHGVLPRPITRGEALRVIEVLQETDVNCPFCAGPICVDDSKCQLCGRSLRKLKIPIELPDLECVPALPPATSDSEGPKEMDCVTVTPGGSVNALGRRHSILASMWPPVRFASAAVAHGLSVASIHSFRAGRMIALETGQGAIRLVRVVDRQLESFAGPGQRTFHYWLRAAAVATALTSVFVFVQIVQALF